MPRLLIALTLFALAQLPAQQTWTGTESTARFAIRCRPGSLAEASVDRAAALVETAFGRELFSAHRVRNPWRRH